MGEDGDAIEGGTGDVVVDLIANFARQREEKGLWLGGDWGMLSERG